MKKRKIIHIAGPSSALQTLNIPQNSDDYIMWSWAQQVARKTVKHINKYEIECWRPEPDIKEVIARKIDGVMFKVFPCFYLKHIGAISFPMLKALKKETRDNEILLHTRLLHSAFGCLILGLYRDTPIVASQHGAIPLLFMYKKKKNPLLLLGHFIEKNILNNVDFFFPRSEGEMEYLTKTLSREIQFATDIGVDFDTIKPIDKSVARRELCIPMNEKVIVFTGTYTKLKGADVALKAFTELKKKYDVELIMMGGSSNDPFFEVAKKSGAQVLGFLDRDKELSLYYSAADVYLLPVFDEGLSRFGGIGVALIESLACGTPVVNTYFKYAFPDEEWEKLGIIPKNEDDVIKCVSDIFDDPSPYKNCREVARKYFDWGVISKNTIKVYDRLFREYYE